MSVHAGHIEFDSVDYDEEGDVLYLSVGEPSAPASSYETVEGHVVRFDARDRLTGLTVINARWLLERDGELPVTLPEHVGGHKLELDIGELRPEVAPAA